MATKTTNTARLFALTSSGACSVTLTQDGKSYTWQALPEGGGQTTFILPLGAEVKLSDENALLSPLPFNIALGAGNSGAEGSEHIVIQHPHPCETAESNAVLSGLTWEALCAAADTDWLKNALRSCVCGDTAYIDLSACAPNSATAAYITQDTPLIAGAADGQLRLGEGIPGLKRMVLKIHNEWRTGQKRTLLCNEEVDFTIISTLFSLCDFAYIGGEETHYRAKSLTVIFPALEGGGSASTNIGFISTHYVPILEESNLAFPIKFIAPAYKKGANFTLRTRENSVWYDDASPIHLNITAAMPSYVSSFSFYKSNFNSVENLIYLMDHLGTPAAESLPQLSFGIAATLVDTSGDTPIYRDAALQAAVERLRSKGWEEVPYPVTETNQ